MTLSVPTATSFRYQGNGSTATFAYDARLFNTSEMVVQLLTRSTSAVEETLTLTTDYSVTILTNGNASVTVTNGAKIPSNTQDIFLSRVVPSTQTTDLPTGTPFPSESVETALDKLTVKIQDVEEELDRAAVVPPQIVGTVTLPIPEANKIIGWNATGDDFTNYTPNTGAFLAVSSYMEPILNSSNEAALKSSINAEADVDFLAYSAARGKFFGDFVGAASGATVNLGSLGSAKINITGTSAITSFGTSVSGQPIYMVRFAAAATLTHGASLILPNNGSNITTAAGDTCFVIDEGFNIFRVYGYQRANGEALVQPSTGIDTLNMQVFASSGTYTPTSGLKYCIVECIGAGGGGGGSNVSASAAGGGGAGGYARKLIDAATVGASQAVTIGAAGAAGTTSGTAGGNGGNTTFGALITANGGTGGAAGTSAGGAGGAGGGATGGNISLNGASGGAGGTVGSAATNTLIAGGKGGDSWFGYGGAIAYSETQGGGTNGVAGSGVGSGGSGAALGNTGTASGGVGTAGYCVVTEFI